MENQLRREFVWQQRVGKFQTAGPEEVTPEEREEVKRKNEKGKQKPKESTRIFPGAHGK